MQEADLQSASDADPNHIALDETVIRITDQRHWLYAAVGPGTNQFLRIGLFQTRTTQLIVLFVRKLHDKQKINQSIFLVDTAHHLTRALH